MEIKCLIVEDELPAINIMEKYIADFPLLKLEGKCRNAMEATVLLHQKQIDLMFLDINMPKMTGLDFLKTLQKPPLVIITTAYREYALDSFELDVLDYLHKPFSFDRFAKAVNKAVEKLSKNITNQYVLPTQKREQLDEDFIFIKDDKITYKVNLKDILYVEAVGDYVKIITTEKVYLSYQSMKNVETYLPPNRFPRVHKSYIVSISKINAIEGNMIHIHNTTIPIGQTFKKDFTELIDYYLKK